MSPPIFTETDVQTYRSAPISDFIAAVPSMEGGLKFMWDVPAQACAKMSSALAKGGWRNPGGPSIFKEAFGEGMDCFRYLGENAGILGDFNNLMAGQRHNRIDWFEFFPVEERLLEGVEEHGVLMVDVGGSRGHEIVTFARRYKDAKGELVLQDLPETIDSIQEADLEGRVEKMKYDFFTEQPVKGE